MNDRLILHYAPDNASLCVRLALAELQLPYDTVLVDRKAQAQRSADYLAMNPNGLIPTLETPDDVLFETGAILLWLADTQPGTLFPTIDDTARAAALTRLFWLSNTVHPTLRMLFYPQQYAPGAEDTLRKTAQERLQDLFAQMANDSAQLQPDRPNLIACYLAPMLRWCALYGGDTSWFSLEKWPSLKAFAMEFEMRPSSKFVAAAEGLGPTLFSRPILPTPPEGSAT